MLLNVKTFGMLKHLKWKTFGIKIIEDFHDLYLEVDFLLLIHKFF